MAVEITMPQMSDTMNEGTILAWLKNEGETVARGDALAEVSTDKSDLEIESFHEGVLIKVTAPVGTTVPVGSVIAYIGETGEEVAVDAAATAPQVESTLVPAIQENETPVVPEDTLTSHPIETDREEGERIKISPLARNLAKSHNLDYSNIFGSGEGGRIVKRDIEARLASPEAPAVPTQTVQPFAGGRFSTEPLSKMRQAIASRMVQAATTIPHFYVTSRIYADQLVRLRESLKPLPQYEGITFNHLIIRAVALALKTCPGINAHYEDGNFIHPQQINIGIVTAVQGGLLIPVLKAADQLPLADIVAEAHGLVQRARAGRPKGDDLVGGTFSVSNIGNFDVERFTAIINPGQGAILAISSIEEEPVALAGEVRVGRVMRVTLSVDHRVIDGVMAGEFLKELKRLLEDPVLLLA